MARELNEPELPDDYPMYPMYLYVHAGKPFQWNHEQTTVGEAKKRLNFQAIHRCDIVGRQSQAEV